MTEKQLWALNDVVENFRAESEQWWARAAKEPTNGKLTQYTERARSWAMAADRVEVDIEKLPNDKLTDGGPKTL